jgi:hypothetical protein
MRIRHSAIIGQPVEVVFSCVIDFSLSSYWASQVRETELLGVGPVRVGFTFQQVREWQGRALSHTYQVIEYLPNERCVLKSIAGLFSTLVQYHFEPHLGGTRFTQEVSAELEAYLEFESEGPELRQLQADLAHLKSWLETRE